MVWWYLTVYDHTNNGSGGMLNNWYLDVTAQNQLWVNPLDNGSTDNCYPLDISISQTMFDCGDVTSSTPTTVTLTVTDPSGNTDDCTSYITVADNWSPIINCNIPVDVSFDANGMATVFPEDVVSGGLFMTGSDNNSGGAGWVDVRVTMPNAYTFTFDWNYQIGDFATEDPFGYTINGSFTQLTNDALGNQGNTATVNVNAGDVFAFRLATDDNYGERATVEITNFSLIFSDDFEDTNWNIVNSGNSDGKSALL